jgi:hypothetical protein
MRTEKQHGGPLAFTCFLQQPAASRTRGAPDRFRVSMLMGVSTRTSDSAHVFLVLFFLNLFWFIFSEYFESRFVSQRLPQGR